MTVTYELNLLDGAVSRAFTDAEKEMLRPIAETIAMLDGNAFFGNTIGDGREWYEQYLPEAWSLFKGNGGSDGWAGETSWIRIIKSESPSVIEARESLRIALSLCGGDEDTGR